ncbi:MAG: winged helix-turn-helix domain-containing protein [Candidatus Hadarchaeum sp.]
MNSTANLVLPYGDRDLLFALSSEAREEILKAVCLRPMKIIEIADLLKIKSQSAVEHLAVLEKARLIESVISKNEQGQPRRIYPSQRIFEINLPFLYDVPLYKEACRLIAEYRSLPEILQKIPKYFEKIKNINISLELDIKKFLPIVESVLSNSLFLLFAFRKKVSLPPRLKEDICPSDTYVSVSLPPEGRFFSRLKENFTVDEFVEPTIFIWPDISFIKIESELKKTDTPLAKAALLTLEEIRKKIPDTKEDLTPYENLCKKCLDLLSKKEEMIKREKEELLNKKSKKEKKEKKEIPEEIIEELVNKRWKKEKHRFEYLSFFESELKRFRDMLNEIETEVGWPW